MTTLPSHSASVRDTIRLSVRTCLQVIRETRANRSVPALLGCGYTVAIAGSTSCFARVAEGYNFSGSWNRGTTYWSRDTANDVKRQIQVARHPLADQLVVIHHNDLRDLSEKSAISCLCHCFKARNCQG